MRAASVARDARPYERTRNTVRLLAALQQLLGHASIVTTQRYAKLSDEAVMREAQRLQAPLGTASVSQVSPDEPAAERRA